MTDIRQLIHQSIEIEGLLKVLLDRGDDCHAVEVLADRFGAYVHDMNGLIQHLQAAAVSSDPHLEEVKEQEAVESEVVPQMVAATDALSENSAPEEEPCDVEEPDPVEETVPEPVVQPKKTMPALRSVLTLNDKFYFIREVFDGNESDFSDTLEVIDGMDSYAEAEGYITGDMMLDRNNPGVRAFLDFLAHNMNP